LPEPESATAADGFRYSSANIYGFTPALTTREGVAEVQPHASFQTARRRIQGNRFRCPADLDTIYTNLL